MTFLLQGISGSLWKISSGLNGEMALDWGRSTGYQEEEGDKKGTVFIGYLLCYLLCASFTCTAHFTLSVAFKLVMDCSYFI